MFASSFPARPFWTRSQWVVLAIGLSAGSSAAETITVQFRDGRPVTGEVDGRTDQQRLWLRIAEGSVALWRSEPWEQVVGAQRGEQWLSAVELRQVADELASELPESFWAPSEERLAEPEAGATADEVTKTDRPAAGRESSASSASRLPPPRASSIHIESFVANWNQTVEPDGLIVRVYPLDAQGAVVPVRGTLTVTLTGQRWASGRSPQRGFVPLGTWRHRIEPHDVGRSGAVFKLPFQSRHPEFDLSLAPTGLVHAQLVVAGQGAFEASKPDVHIRPTSLLRDQLQLREGRRYLEFERTGRGGH